MKIIVEFESLEEFVSFGNLDKTKPYESGDDDVGGKFYKDIKDIDEVATDYDAMLYANAVELFELYEREEPKRVHIAKDIVKKEVGDYEIRKGLSDDAYKQLIKKLSSLCHVSDVYEYTKVNAKYE